MAERSQLDIRPVGDPGTFALVGEIDLSTAGRIAEIPVSAVGDETVVLDFSDVSFMDSSGIRALVRLARTLKLGTLVIWGARGRVRRMLELLDVGMATGIVVR
jgi:anti-anti-sigma factor